MLYHLSIAAEDPRRVATLIANLWDGRALPFPRVKGAWLAVADDDRHSLIEVMPLEFEFVPGMAEEPAQAHRNPRPSRFSACHAAVATHLEADAVLALAADEGWIAKLCTRAGHDVVELWLEDGFLIEVMTPSMLAAYLDAGAAERALALTPLRLAA